MPVGGAIGGIVGGIGSIIGGGEQASAASSAAQDQTQAQMAAIAAEQQQFAQSRSDEMPYMQAGQGALAQLGQLNSGNYSSFHESPDYNFQMAQGEQAVDRGAAARGSLYSGGNTADELKFSQGLADQSYDDYYNKIAGIANLGQDATARTGVLGAGAANAVANSLGNIGNAQAQGAIGAGNAWASGINGLAGSLGYMSRSSFGNQGYGSLANIGRQTGNYFGNYASLRGNYGYGG